MTLRWGEFLKQLKAEAKAKKQPYYAGFELTSRCNFQCKMCYVCNPPNDKMAGTEELGAREWIRLGREVRDAGVLIITLTGGEVFLRPDLQEIYEALAKMGLMVQINSNGSMITPEIVKWLSKIPPFKVSITLYGDDRETYQKITGHADGYDRTVKAIDSLIDAGIATGIRTTIIPDNIDSFDNIRKLCLERTSTCGLVKYVSPRREGLKSDPETCRLTPEELVRFEKHILNLDKQIDTADPEGTPVAFNDEGLEDIYPGKDKDIENDPSDAFNCGAAKNFFWITWRGDLAPCNLMDQPNISLLDKSFPEAWKELNHKCSLIPICEECSQCRYRNFCDTCPARLLRETGGFNQPAPYLCEIARLRRQMLNQGVEP